ncbi:MAG: glycosyltransferase family 9 protein, partial [Planctomycetota bacterium]
MATPLFDCLRASFPQARIACVIRGYAQGIVRDGPWFDEVINAKDKSWAGFWTLRRQVAAFGADTAVLLPNSLRSALPIRLAGVPKIYGYRRGGRGCLLTGGPAPVKQNGKITPLPMTEYYLEIARFLGLEVPASPKPTLYVGLECRQRA